MKQSAKNQTKTKIVTTAWQLFYQNGYENTTIDEIVEASHTSKGSFYYYFESKDSLLNSLSYLFDEKYEELFPTLDPSLSPIDKLIYLNHELFLMIDNTVPVPILNKLFSSQLTGRSERYLLEPDRTYYKVLRQIAIEGQQQGIWRDDLSVSDITKAYAVFERGLMYDFCLCNGSYSLSQFSEKMLPLFLKGLSK